MTLFDLPAAPAAPAAPPAPRIVPVVSFTAHGFPKPQGSKRPFINRHTGRAGMAESGEKAHKAWRSTVTDAALGAYADRPLLDGPLAVELVFALPRPKSHPKTRRTWPQNRPDIDKLVRACFDSLTHVIWRDDSQVVDLTTRKVWAEIDVPHGAGVDITVSIIEDDV